MKQIHRVHAQQFNALAIDFLEFFGNNQPNQQQIDTIEIALADCVKKHRLLFSSPIAASERQHLFLLTLQQLSAETVKQLQINQSMLSVV